jgi:hypothetical protein
LSRPKDKSPKKKHLDIPKSQRQLHKKIEKTEERDESWELFFQLCDITKVTIVNNLAVIRISKQKKIFTYFWVTH